MPNSWDEKRVREILEIGVKNRIFPGCVLALFKKNQDGSFEENVFTHGNFTYDKDSRVVTEDTIYDLASFTKTFSTGLIFLKFIEEGKISLEDRIIKYLEDFNDKEASILHLLTYTLNFKNFTEEEKKKFIETMDIKDFRKNILKIPFESQPGLVYKYSDATANLQGMILEKVSSKNLKELFDLYVKDFFNLKNTSLESGDLKKQNIPPTQILGNGEVVQAEVNDAKSRFAYRNGVFSGCAGLFGDVFDISKLCKCILDFGVYEDKIFLKKDAINLMQKNNLSLDLPTPICTGDNSTTALRRELGMERKIIGKSGFTGCQVMLDLENGKGMVFLSNRTYPDASKFYPEWDEFRRELVTYIFQ